MLTIKIPGCTTSSLRRFLSRLLLTFLPQMVFICLNDAYEIRLILLILYIWTVIQVTSTFHDHTRNTKRSVNSTIIVTESLVTASPHVDVGDVIGSTVSPSLNRRAILREVKDQPKSKRYVEIWYKDGLEASIDVTDEHGSFYTDGGEISRHHQAQNLISRTNRAPIVPIFLADRNVRALCCRTQIRR